MGFEDYLEFVRREDSGNEYPRIVVNGSASVKSGIDYVELRPDGDYFRVANRNFPLRSLASEAGLSCINFSYDLIKILEQARRARFCVSIEVEGSINDIVLNSEHILAIAKLEERLAGYHTGIRRNTGVTVVI